MSKMHLYPVPEQNALDVFAHLDPCWPPAGPAARPNGGSNPSRAHDSVAG
eukprot:COSAG06_NODE_5335_length_3541_cov_2.269030_1_plen_50_part_00